MTFEEYLIGKKIDSEAFRLAESERWSLWKNEFEQMHPSSFTSQKLYLINPIRLSYPFKGASDQTKSVNEPVGQSSPVKPAVAKPVFKPKPKIN